MVLSKEQCSICFNYWVSRGRYMEGYQYLIHDQHIPEAHAAYNQTHGGGHQTGGGSKPTKTDKCHKHKAKITKLKERVEELENEKSKLKERVHQLKQELAGCKADNQRLGTEKAALANDKKNLESDKTALTGARNNAQNDYKKIYGKKQKADTYIVTLTTTLQLNNIPVPPPP